MNDGTINTLGKVSPGTSYQTQSYNLNRNAKQITFTLSGTLKKYTKDIKVTLAYYIEQGSAIIRIFRRNTATRTKSHNQLFWID